MRDVSRQLIRNREAFSARPEDMPVFGASAATFNDYGVTALYQHLAGLLQEHGLPLSGGTLPRGAFVEGRSLTWYGSSLVTARGVLAAQLAAPSTQCAVGHCRSSWAKVSDPKVLAIQNWIQYRNSIAPTPGR